MKNYVKLAGIALAVIFALSMAACSNSSTDDWEDYLNSLNTGPIPNDILSKFNLDQSINSFVTANPSGYRGWENYFDYDDILELVWTDKNQATVDSMKTALTTLLGVNAGDWIDYSHDGYYGIKVDYDTDIHCAIGLSKTAVDEVPAGTIFVSFVVYTRP